MQESDEGGMFKVLVWYVKLKRKQRVSREGGSSKRVSSPPHESWASPHRSQQNQRGGANWGLGGGANMMVSHCFEAFPFHIFLNSSSVFIGASKSNFSKNRPSHSRTLSRILETSSSDLHACPLSKRGKEGEREQKSETPNSWIHLNVFLMCAVIYGKDFISPPLVTLNPSEATPAVFG